MGTGRSAALRSALSAARFLAAYGLLPNFAFALAGHWLYLVRPLFNIDYLLIGALLPRLGRRATGVLLGVALANDVICNAAPACNFTLPDFLRSLRHLDVIAPWALALGVLALVILSTLFAFAVLRTGGPTPWPRSALALVALLAATDLVPGALPFANSGVGTTLAALSERPAYVPPPPITPVVAPRELPPQSKAVLDAGTVEVEPSPMASKVLALPYGARSASAGLLASARDVSTSLPKHNLVLILVESLGRLRDDDAAALLMRPLTQLSSRYEVETGAVPFGGATMRGELRELCGADFDGDFAEHPACLPSLLATRGYRTLAMHGFTRGMYDRSSWYPRVGFQHLLFAEDLKAEGLSRTCGSVWRGLCDADVGERLDRELRASTEGTPRFIYWMTLNSHLPETDTFGTDAFDCAATVPTRESLLCLHARALSTALVAIARVAADPLLPPTDFVIVGDHAPPFPGRAQRQAFDDAHVPYVTLSWKL